MFSKLSPSKSRHSPSHPKMSSINCGLKSTSLMFAMPAAPTSQTNRLSPGKTPAAVAAGKGGKGGGGGTKGKLAKKESNLADKIYIPDEIMKKGGKMIMCSREGIMKRTEDGKIVLSGKPALLAWCKKCTREYDDVDLQNFSSSFRSGLVFCGIIHYYQPGLIDFHSLKKEDILENNQLAFQVAEKLGITPLLDAEDMLALEVPDKLSIMTYVSLYYHHFKNKNPVECEKCEDIRKERVYDMKTLIKRYCDETFYYAWEQKEEEKDKGNSSTPSLDKNANPKINKNIKGQR